MIIAGLVGLLGMLIVAAWPTRAERHRWSVERDDRRSLRAHSRLVRDLHASPRRAYGPGTVR